MYLEDDYLMISGIQHFVYCRRQWALVHVEDKWIENYFTADGRVIHNRVHQQGIQDIRNGVLTIRGLNVSSAKYGISGTCDAVEFLPVNDGITLHGRDGLWKPLPVEYKRGKSKINNCDRLQVTAQAVCLEEMFSCVIDYGFIFYKETRRREKVEITAEMRDELTKALEEMHSYYRRGYTPRVKPSKKCEKCSLSSECMPSLLRSEENVDAYIRRHMEESENA